MAERRPAAEEGNRGGLADLGDVVRQVIEDAVRQEVRALREALRRERDEALGALRERLQRLEARAAAVEERVASAEGTVQTLDESLQRALSTVIPRADALLARLEEQATSGRPSTSTPTSTPAGVSSPASSCASGPPAGSALGAPAPAGAAGDEGGERRRLQQRIVEVQRRKERARAAPSSLGEDLCEAANKGNLGDVRRLLDGGADVNYTNTAGRSPLISTFCYNFSTKGGDPAVVSLLLKRGADVGAVDVNGQTALHFAAWLDKSGRGVALLLGAGADVDARDENGATPLHCAATWNNEAAVRTLLAAGARKHIRGWGATYKNKAPFDVAGASAIRNLLRP